MSKFVILHKKKDTLNRLCCIMKVTKQTLQHLRKKVSLANTIHHSTFIYNQFKKLNLCKSLSVLLFTRHYPARCFDMNMSKSRDIHREFMRLA